MKAERIKQMFFPLLFCCGYCVIAAVIITVALSLDLDVTAIYERIAGCPMFFMSVGVGISVMFVLRWLTAEQTIFYIASLLALLAPLIFVILSYIGDKRWKFVTIIFLAMDAIANAAVIWMNTTHLMAVLIDMALIVVICLGRKFRWKERQTE